jgi:hypothetical protein
VTVDVKTAKDLPVGSDVLCNGLTWSKVGEDLWAAAGGKPARDADLDELLEVGGLITFIPAGRGRWMARGEREVAQAEEGSNR